MKQTRNETKLRCNSKLKHKRNNMKPILKSSKYKKDNSNMKRDVIDSCRSLLLIAIQQWIVKNAIGSSRFPLLYYVGNCACCKKCES